MNDTSESGVASGRAVIWWECIVMLNIKSVEDIDYAVVKRC